MNRTPCRRPGTSRRLTAALAAGLCLVLTVSGQVVVEDSGEVRGLVGADGRWTRLDPRGQHEVRLPGHEGHVYLLRRIRLDTGLIPYAFNYAHCLHPVHCLKAPPLFSSGLGMDKPASENWAEGGFFDLTLDGVSLCDSRAAFSVFGAGEETGGLEVVWNNERATTSVRITAQSQEVRLLVEARVALKVAPGKVAMHFRCYPNTHAGNAAGASLRERHLCTARRDVAMKHGQPAQALALAPSEPWMIYYDAAFDLGQTRAAAGNGGSWTGTGPCALAYDVNDVHQVTVFLTNYHIDTMLTYPADAPSMRVLLWDFARGSGARRNREVIEMFKSVKVLTSRDGAHE